MIKRGQIYWVQLDPTLGSEIQKTRPCLVVSNNQANSYSATITIIPITSMVPSRIYPFEISVEAGVGGLKKNGLVKVNQIRAVDKLRVGDKPMGSSVDEQTMRRVDKAIMIHLSIS